MLSIASCRRRASRRAGKPGLVYGPLAPRQVDIVLDHHLDQLGEANPRLPAQNAKTERSRGEWRMISSSTLA